VENDIFASLHLEVMKIQWRQWIGFASCKDRGN